MSDLKEPGELVSPRYRCGNGHTTLQPLERNVGRWGIPGSRDELSALPIVVAVCRECGEEMNEEVDDAD